MWRRWAGPLRVWLVSGGYLMFLMPGLYLGTPVAWRLSVGCTALLALCAWLMVLTRLRVFSDTPMSVVASAAQGYVAIRGSGRQFEGYPVFAPHRGVPCLWYRYRIEHRHDRKWTTESVEESSTSFIVDDGTGCCTVDPEGAEVLVSQRQSWTDGDERYTLELVLPGECVQLLGEFRTLGGDTADLNPKRDTSELLRHWKQDMSHLVRQYDRNADGAIDLQEWEFARRDAEREVQLIHRDIRAQPHTHSVARCASGRPYIISTREPKRVVLGLRLWAAGHALSFLLAFACLFQV